MTFSPFRRAHTRAKAALSGPRGPLLVALASIAISLPALGLGFMADDHLLAWQLQHGERPWGLFQASEASLRELRSVGAIAWWASPRLALKFFRPIASLSHALDFALWPHAAWLMTLWNVLLYGACTLLAALLFRRLTRSPWAAGLAALLFAIDEAHGVSVGWIAGRNTLLALLGSLSALYLHLRARSERRRSLALLAPLAVAFALSSAEAGSWALGLLLAYALVLEPGSYRQRLSTIAPQLIVGALWASLYLALGCGIRGASFYRELTSPIDALAQGLLDLPLALTSLLGPSVVAFTAMVPAHEARLMALPVALISLGLAWPSRLLRDDASFRFFVLATFACLPPAFLALAQDRTLMGASFGAFGWLASVLVEVAQRSGLLARIRVGVLVLVHVLLALPMYELSLASVRRFENGAQALVAITKPGREVVLVNTPVELLSNYTIAIHDRAGRSLRSLHQLYAGGSELWLERVDAHTLDVTATRGWGYVPIERIFCAPADLPKAGSALQVQGMTIRVLGSTEAGAPAHVRFTFATPLEAGERQWLIWRGSQPVPFQPPAPGQRIRLAASPILKALRP